MSKVGLSPSEFRVLALIDAEEHHAGGPVFLSDQRIGRTIGMPTSVVARTVKRLKYRRALALIPKPGSKKMLWDVRPCQCWRQERISLMDVPKRSTTIPDKRLPYQIEKQKKYLQQAS